MRYIIIGGVAAGTSAAAKARRNNEEAEIVIYEKDVHISYSGCGLPYYLGGEVAAIEELAPRDPAFFKKKYNVDVKIRHEVISVDSQTKTLRVRDFDGQVFEDKYDKLVIATGASVKLPPIEGVHLSHVFTLRNVVDAAKIRDYMISNNVKKAVIAGSGFIGFEVLENLMLEGLDVTMVEMADQIATGLDKDMSTYLQAALQKKNVKMLVSTSIKEVKKDCVILSNEEELEAQLVIMVTGVKPNVDLAKAMGVEIGETGAIKVNTKMETNVSDVYACGDCIETFNSITGKPTYKPLGSTANKCGRIAGDNLSGGHNEYRGNLGTAIFKVFDVVVAQSGLSEKEANAQFDTIVCHNIKPDKPAYMNGQEMLIKAVANKENGQLLGVQIVGGAGVDKRIDVFATLITYGAKVEDLFHLDLAYTPAFSTTKDPIHYTGMILDNALNTNREIITTAQLEQLQDVKIIDARSNSDYTNKGCVEGAINIPHAKLRNAIDTLDKEQVVVTYCNKGVTGNAAQNILLGHGFKKVYNLSGGHRIYKTLKK